MPTREQLKAFVDKAKSTGVSDQEIFKYMVDKGAFNEQGEATVDDSGQVVAKQKGIMEKTAGVINKGYDVYKNLPVIKQATQLVGGAVGAAGGIIGGAVGAVANPVANIIEGKPVFEGEGRAIAETAKSTAKFGYDIGKEGAAAAPLSGAGRAVNLAVAYGQGYQGADELVQGYREGDAAKMFEGGLSLGTSVVGARSAMKTRGFFVDPEAAKVIKEAPSQMREALLRKTYQKTVDSYRQTMNLSRADLVHEANNMKDTPKFLAEQGIIPERGPDGKFSVDGNIEKLQERMEPVQQELTNTLKENPKPMDLDVLEKRAVSEVQGKKEIPAIDRKEMVKSIQETIDAEKEANGGTLDPKTGRVEGGNILQSPEFNQTKSSFWNKSYNPAKTKVANSSVWQLGHEAKRMIEEAYKREANIGGMNRLIGDYASAIRLLDKSLRGKVIPGGVMSRMLYKIVGATAFSGAGPVASMIGAEGVSRIVGLLSSPEVKLGAHQKALQFLKGEDGGAKSPFIQSLLDRYSKEYDSVKAQYAAPITPPDASAPSGVPSAAQTPSPQASQAPTAPQTPTFEGMGNKEMMEMSGEPIENWKIDQTKNRLLSELDASAPKPVEQLAKQPNVENLPPAHREVRPLNPGEKVAPEVVRANYKKLIKYAEEAKTFVDTLASTVAEETKSKVAKAPIKGEARSVEKAVGDYGGDITRVGDLARNTIVGSNEMSMKKAVDILKDDPSVRSVKEAVATEDPLGYSGYNIKVVHPNGILAEIQVNSPEMIYAKESPKNAISILGRKKYMEIKLKTGIEGGRGHKMYEEWRELDFTDPSTYQKKRQIEMESKKYYNLIRKNYAAKITEPYKSESARRIYPAAAAGASSREEENR